MVTSSLLGSLSSVASEPRVWHFDLQMGLVIMIPLRDIVHAAQQLCNMNSIFGNETRERQADADKDPGRGPEMPDIEKHQERLVSYATEAEEFSAAVKPDDQPVNVLLLRLVDIFASILLDQNLLAQRLATPMLITQQRACRKPNNLSSTNSNIKAIKKYYYMKNPQKSVNILRGDAMQ